MHRFQPKFKPDLTGPSRKDRKLSVLKLRKTLLNKGKHAFMAIVGSFEGVLDYKYIRVSVH